MNIVEIKNLNKTYPSFRLKDVSFDIHEGEITGFVGRNGAGKTTTIKSMLNLVHPDSGEIRFFGKTMKGEGERPEKSAKEKPEKSAKEKSEKSAKKAAADNEAKIKQMIGYSTGSISWYPRKRIKDMVAVIRYFYDTWDEEAYDKYLVMFGLDENKTPMELSEGMKVKFNLLIALSHHAKVLVLDEPTSGLDPFSRDELLDLFEELKKEGTAIFFSTHIVSDLEKCADRIIYISRGEIVAALPKDEFVKNYAKEGESLEETILRMEKEGAHA